MPQDVPDLVKSPGNIKDWMLLIQSSGMGYILKKFVLEGPETLLMMVHLSAMMPALSAWRSGYWLAFRVVCANDEDYGRTGLSTVLVLGSVGDDRKSRMDWGSEDMLPLLLYRVLLVRHWSEPNYTRVSQKMFGVEGACCEELVK